MPHVGVPPGITACLTSRECFQACAGVNGLSIISVLYVVLLLLVLTS